MNLFTRYTYALAAILAFGGCATNPTTGQVTLKTVDFTATKLATASHADLQAAAKRATTNGYPSRAAFWTAVDGLLTAQEAQANACEAAIAAALPKTSASPAFAGPADALEAGAEAVGSFSGIPASVRITCEPLPIPSLPALPLIPKF
jgi:hypothetical protein